MGRIGSNRRSPVGLLLCVAAGALAGCTTLEALSNWTAWTQQESAPLETPDQRVQRLKQLGAEAPWWPAERQRALAAQLAQQLAKEPDPLVRRQMVHTLGRLQGPESQAALHQALRDPEVQVQVEAVWAWARQGSQAALPVLTQLLSQPQVPLDVRLAAVRALGELKDPQAVPVLARLLDDPDPAIQYRTVRSLEQITGKYYGEDVNQWKRALAGEAVPEQPRWSLSRWWKQLF